MNLGAEDGVSRSCSFGMYNEQEHRDESEARVSLKNQLWGGIRSACSLTTYTTLTCWMLDVWSAAELIDSKHTTHLSLCASLVIISYLI